MFRRYVSLSILSLLLSVNLSVAPIHADDWTPLWTTAHLSQPRDELAAVTAGGKVFFAGGNLVDGTSSDVIDIYDLTTGLWSVAHLSVAREHLSATSVGDKVSLAVVVRQHLHRLILLMRSTRTRVLGPPEACRSQGKAPVRLAQTTKPSLQGEDG